MRLSDTNHEIYLARDDGTRLAIVEEAYRFEYVRKVNDIGGFEVVLPGDFDASLVDAEYDRRVEFWRKPAAGVMQQEAVYFIRKTAWSVDENGVERLSVSGPGVNHLLARRIVYYRVNDTYVEKTDYADDMMKEVVNQAMGPGAYLASQRAWNSSYFSIAPDLSLGPTVTLRFPWQNVFETLVDIAAAARNEGAPVFFDLTPEGAAFVFRTFVNQRGADRREGFSARPVIFGLDYGNLELPALDIDWTDEKSWGAVTGHGAGLDQASSGLGLARRNRSLWAHSEIHISSQLDANAKMRYLAAIKLYSEYNVKHKLSGRLKDAPGSQYGHHWFYGDYVTIDAFGLQSDAHVDSVRIAVDEDGVETLDAEVERYAG